MNMNSIVEKLPENVKKMMDNPLMDAKTWTREWDDWAKSVLYELCLARDDMIISEEERAFLHHECFKDVGNLGFPKDDKFFRFFLGIWTAHTIEDAPYKKEYERTLEDDLVMDDYMEGVVYGTYDDEKPIVPVIGSIHYISEESAEGVQSDGRNNTGLPQMPGQASTDFERE